MQITWHLRRVIFYVLLSLLTVFFALTGLFTILVPFKWRYWYITRWSFITIWLAKIICQLKYKVTGMENFPTKQAFIVLSNHQSAWETIFMQVLLPPQSWVLKKELLFIPFFGWGLALLKPIAINRKDFFSAKSILRQGLQKLHAGMCVLIFPEGTRVAPGLHAKFKKTGAELAIQAQVPIIPIAHNAGRFWPRGPWITKPGTIEVVIGKAIMPIGSAHDLIEQVKGFITSQNL
jgi:1-acyl-sn-glycerol-3-phosphate acyltransferase